VALEALTGREEQTPVDGPWCAEKNRYLCEWPLLWLETPFTFKGHTATDIGSGALAIAISWDLGKSLLH